MSHSAPELHAVWQTEHRIVSVDARGALSEGEKIVSVSGEGDALLGLTNVQPSSIELSINGLGVPIGQAVLFTVNPDTAPPGNYTINLFMTTDSIPPQVVGGSITIAVEVRGG